MVHARVSTSNCQHKRPASDCAGQLRQASGRQILSKHIACASAPGLADVSCSKPPSLKIAQRQAVYEVMTSLPRRRTAAHAAAELRTGMTPAATVRSGCNEHAAASTPSQASQARCQSQPAPAPQPLAQSCPATPHSTRPFTQAALKAMHTQQLVRCNEKTALHAVRQSQSSSAPTNEAAQRAALASAGSAAHRCLQQCPARAIAETKLQQLTASLQGAQGHTRSTPTKAENKPPLAPIKAASATVTSGARTLCSRAGRLPVTAAVLAEVPQRMLCSSRWSHRAQQRPPTHPAASSHCALGAAEQPHGAACAGEDLVTDSLGAIEHQSEPGNCGASPKKKEATQAGVPSIPRPNSADAAAEQSGKPGSGSCKQLRGTSEASAHHALCGSAPGCLPTRQNTAPLYPVAGAGGTHQLTAAASLLPQETPRPRRPGTALDDLDTFFAQLRNSAAQEPALPEVDLVHGGLVDTEGDAASVPQAEAMVLSLEDPYSSSAAVLALELDRMDVEELEEFEAQLDAASLARSAGDARA